MDSPPITWYEFSIILGAFSTVLAGLFGFLWMIINSLGKSITDLRKAIDEHRIEVAKTYATQQAVIQIEERLTRSINEMAERLDRAFSHLTGRVEAVVGQVLTALTTKSQ